MRLPISSLVWDGRELLRASRTSPVRAAHAGAPFCWAVLGILQAFGTNSDPSEPAKAHSDSATRVHDSYDYDAFADARVEAMRLTARYQQLATHDPRGAGTGARSVTSDEEEP